MLQATCSVKGNTTFYADVHDLGKIYISQIVNITYRFYSRLSTLILEAVAAIL